MNDHLSPDSIPHQPARGQRRPGPQPDRQSHHGRNHRRALLAPRLSQGLAGCFRHRRHRQPDRADHRRQRARRSRASAFTFDEVEAGIDDKHHVAAGYDADVLLRWGDPLFADAPEFDPPKQTAEAQAKQFGYNNDYVGYIPLEGSAEHGLLVVNHEYTNPHLMFPGIVKIVEKDGKKMIEVATLTKEQVDIEMAAHGGTIVEIRKEGGKWQVVKDGKLNRRITANTEMQLTGPAAGNDRLKTNADATGTKVFGTINNCAGGVTPWGTYVMAEENIHGYFSGELPADHKEAANYKRMGIPEGVYDWASVLRPLRSRQGAERGQPLRLDRRGRRQRSELDPEEAHRAWPLQA